VSLGWKIDMCIAVEQNRGCLYYNRGDFKLFDDAVTPSVVSSFGIFGLSLLLHKKYGV